MESKQNGWDTELFVENSGILGLNKWSLCQNKRHDHLSQMTHLCTQDIVYIVKLFVFKELALQGYAQDM